MRSFLETDATLNHQLANYVCRTAGVLLQRKISEARCVVVLSVGAPLSLTLTHSHSQTIEFMKERNMIQHFIKHLNNASVMDLLLKGAAAAAARHGPPRSTFVGSQ